MSSTIQAPGFTISIHPSTIESRQVQVMQEYIDRAKQLLNSQEGTDSARGGGSYLQSVAQAQVGDILTLPTNILMQLSIQMQSTITVDEVVDSVRTQLEKLGIQAPNLSLKTQAWKTWLETTGKKLGRKEDDIEINGNIVTVKIPGYGNLVFDPSKYKFGEQRSIDNTSKFSKKDFEKLIEFIGGSKQDRYIEVGEQGVSFFTQVLGLKKGFYWSSKYYLNANIWGLSIDLDRVYIDFKYQGHLNSAIIF